MKVNLNREAFAEAINLVMSVVPTRTPKPILSCVRIIADEKEVSICATDMEVGIIISIHNVEVKQAGQAVIPAARVAAIARESVDDVLEMEVKDNVCEIRGADSRFTIYGQEPGQYPAVPGFEGKADVTIKLEELRRGIEQCLFATARESTRYALNGVLWEIKGKRLFLVATDGRRLARVRTNLASAPKAEVEAKKIIVPAKTMGLLEKIGGGGEDVVTVKLVDNQIQIGCGSVMINSNLVEGSFPKYEDIIPTDYNKELSLPTEAVLSAVRRSALLTSEESRGIRLAISKNKLVFSGRSPETGDAQITMATNYEGGDIEIGFNPQFLVDFLRVVQTEQVELKLSEADRPGLIKSGKDFIYVLMQIS